jgi:hypothetical protein
MQRIDPGFPMIIAKSYLPAIATLLLLFVTTVFAEEKQGLRIEIVPKSGENRSKASKALGDWVDVDKDMSLKAAVKNVSMHDTPESTIEYTILVSRWDGSEVEKFVRYTGNLTLKALRPAEQTEIAVGQYKIGGHLHGTSPRHEDKLAGWKLVVTQAGKPIDFHTPATFEAMSKTAKVP